MVFVPDSRTVGYLGPVVTTPPLEDAAWNDFLQEMVAGVTGLDPTLVRPRWQPEPPDQPDFNVSWAAVGINNTEADWQPAVIHVDVGDGHDFFQRMETVTLLCSFYGPNCSYYASLMRDGLFIDQNRALLRANAVAVIEVTDFLRVPELFKQRWLDRIDTNVMIRREVRRTYPVLSLLRSSGKIIANPAGSYIIRDNWQTRFLPTADGIAIATSITIGVGAKTVAANGISSAISNVNGLSI